MYVYIRRAVSEQDLDVIGATCDFCGTPEVRWLFPRAAMSELQPHWRACQDCKVLIDADDWPGIEMKITRWVREKFPIVSRSLLLNIVQMTLEDFFQYAERSRG